MAGISEAITQIKKAESDADSLVEQSTVDAKAIMQKKMQRKKLNLLLLKQKKMLKASKMTQEKI